MMVEVLTVDTGALIIVARTGFLGNYITVRFQRILRFVTNATTLLAFGQTICFSERKLIISRIRLQKAARPFRTIAENAAGRIY